MTYQGPWNLLPRTGQAIRAVLGQKVIDGRRSTALPRLFEPLHHGVYELLPRRQTGGRLHEAAGFAMGLEQRLPFRLGLRKLLLKRFDVQFALAENVSGFRNINERFRFGQRAR